MIRCVRCEFRTEDDDEAAEHARDSGHVRCIVCRRRFLTEFERQTCQQCIGDVRTNLADILDGYAVLEPATAEALTLLGDGTMQRLFHSYENEATSRHPLARDDEPAPPPIRDEWPSDPLPVLPALASWEDYAREYYGDPKGQPDPTLSAVVGWLMSNLDTGRCLAQSFPAFDEMALEIRRHYWTIQHVAGLANDPETADTECLECGGDLVRHYRELNRDPETDPRGREQEGREDYWTCRGCERVLSPVEYVFHVKAKLEAKLEAEARSEAS